jgi:hypothetical protein
MRRNYMCCCRVTRLADPPVGINPQGFLWKIRLAGGDEPLTLSGTPLAATHLLYFGNFL